MCCVHLAFQKSHCWEGKQPNPGIFRNSRAFFLPGSFAGLLPPPPPCTLWNADVWWQQVAVYPPSFAQKMKVWWSSKGLRVLGSRMSSCHIVLVKILTANVGFWPCPTSQKDPFRKRKPQHTSFVGPSSVTAHVLAAWEISLEKQPKRKSSSRGTGWIHLRRERGSCCIFLWSAMLRKHLEQSVLRWGLKMWNGNCAVAESIKSNVTSDAKQNLEPQNDLKPCEQHWKIMRLSNKEQ